MLENHKNYAEARGWNAEYFLKKASEIGPSFKEVIKITTSRRFTEQTYNSCLGLLRLKNKYGNERLEKASIDGCADCGHINMSRIY